MTLDLTPWRRRKTRLQDTALRRREDPVTSLRRDMDSLLGSFFDDIGGTLGWPAAGDSFALAPRVDVSETEKEVQVSADLPGLQEKDIELTLDEGGLLTLSGSFEREEETKQRQYQVMERASGSFRRTIPLPESIDPDQVSARFKNGVLQVVIRKRPEAAGPRRKVKIEME